jgi:hypothetical protein
MVKKIPSHLVSKAGKCIFCGNPGLTKTHIWPSWLNSIIPAGNTRDEELVDEVHISPDNSILNHQNRLRQGSIFSQKPYLACEKCNNGWMKKFEDEMVKFSKSLFTTFAPTNLNHRQTRILSVWISLITILAEFSDKTRKSACITSQDRSHLMEYFAPPDTWSIFACSLDADRWNVMYRHHSISIHEYENFAEFSATFLIERPKNTQISSFGFGKIFIQVFSCPNLRLVTDFRIAAKAKRLVQLWPPSSRLWPFPKGTAKFPTKLILDDSEADVVSDAFNERLKFLTGPKSISVRR